VLRLPIKRVVIASVAKVQKTSCRGQKVECSFGIASRALEDASPLPRPLLCFLQMKEQGEPDCQVIVTKSAGALLEVWLKVEDGVAVLGVPPARNLTQLLRDRVPLAYHQCVQNVLM